ncbi:DUF4097 family beta strand repeat-containing protein [Pseudarthrobacter sp. C4D7]|uniref:DUF4097 family beta strand repeat-containing protein n=1 Tax=Pseudarthrobacter sp. C4D7 TaxID=2735268 RepID=UPI001584789D|nr:DUF4097 family beta strand repeat-containing protein [Pseudarthrobacter sp. C4D7]NUT70076.1 DUF4097 family beta strand repeat protein [Pseudarthrobacter sp. C4D7]
MTGENWTVAGPQTIDVDAVSSVKLGMVRGRFEIVGYDGPTVRLEFSEVHGDPVAVSLNDGRLEVRHQLHGAQGWFKNLMETVNHNSDNFAVITVAVPPGVDVEAGTASGEGTVSGISAHLRLNTVSGSIAAENTSGELQLNTVSGAVAVRNHQGVLTAKSISGEINASGRFSHVRTNTVSGHLSFDLLDYTQDFGSNSVSGDLAITLPADVGVDLVAKSAGGAVILDGRQVILANGTVETISGPDGQLMLVRTNSVSGKTSISHASANVDPHGEAGR